MYVQNITSTFKMNVLPFRMGKTCVNLTLEQKYDVIRIVTKEKKPVKEVAAIFKCGKSQIYNILKQKGEILQLCDTLNRNDLQKKKKRAAPNEKINEALYKWFCVARTKNFPISGPILQEKAKEFATHLNIESFKASNGWLESFKKTYNITYKVSCGEANDVDNSIVENWKSKLQNLIKDYEPKNIGNVDETDLFYRLLPNKTFQVKGERCHGGKMSKERLTVMLLVFADGLIEKPFVIGKSANPRCFRNLNIKKLPVEYRANSKAWMTASYFESFLKNLNSKMRKEKRKILLFLDNASCHPHIELSNIKLAFFPANTTSHLQPLDNGVIQSLKLNYRKLMLKKLLQSMDNCDKVSNLTKKITVLDAVCFLAESAKMIKKRCIKKCFHNCGFPLTDNLCLEVSEFDTNNIIEEDVIENAFSELQNLMYSLEGDGMPSASEFANCDVELFTEVEEPDLLHFIEIDNNNIDSTVISDSSDNEENSQPPTAETVQCSLRNLEDYAKHNGDNDFFDKVTELNLMFNEKFKQKLNPS